MNINKKIWNGELKRNHKYYLHWNKKIEYFDTLDSGMIRIKYKLSYRVLITILLPFILILRMVMNGVLSYEKQVTLYIEIMSGLKNLLIPLDHNDFVEMVFNKSIKSKYSAR